MSEATINQITWTEIPVLDLARAQKFYAEVFGWEYVPMPAVCRETGEALPEPQVAMFMKGAMRGSLVKTEPHNHLSAAKHADNADKKKTSVTVTLNTASIDEVFKVVEKAGGSIYVPKMKIPGGDDMGHLGYILDTEQNVMGVWSKE